MPAWQRIIETTLFVPVGLWIVYTTVPLLDCAFSSRPKNYSRYAVLTLYSLIFGAELAFKMISKRTCFLFRLNMYFMPGAFFALAFPILNTRFTRAYRVIAVAHQFLLIPIISKTYSAIASSIIDVFPGLQYKIYSNMVHFNELVILVCLIHAVSTDRFVTQLLEHLLTDYNKNVRPVKNASDSLHVKFGANLCRLIDVDEVNQVLTTSLWLEMQWSDRKLVWNPFEWGGVERVHIPSDQIWIPDILLYNNADGEPHITIDSLALVDYRGTVLWQPPSIYKSLCPINIEYFPYDSQECHLKFGGWSNDGQTLALEQIPVNIHDRPVKKIDSTGTEFLYLEQGLGLSFYHESAEWDLLRATSSRYAQIYPGCCGQQYYIDIRYNIVIRRKAIFFTVMLTIPCMLIANTTPFVFMIPPNEHKMTFSISIFVAFTVFYLVLIELIPPTSLVLPLIGKYLLFTLMMITVSILISVVNINIYRRQAFASEMSPWQRWLFVKTLPKYFRLKRLAIDTSDSVESSVTITKGTWVFLDSLTHGEPKLDKKGKLFLKCHDYGFSVSYR
uniref:Neur_chan_LBD domain-containing protein n=1 Tax=Heterorhabditis bacteriophora TaxID=37862 RepID=A0A1I7XFN3_HETBA